MNYGRYQIIKELGRGSMGVVYQAYDPQFDRSLALKVMRQDRVTSDAYVKRFFKEAKAIGRLLHRNIVTAFDAGEDQGSIYIAMEFVEGQPLDQVISVRRFEAPEVLDLGIQVAEALDYAHQKGVVHRDIKPSNIILQPEDQIKITDFGIAHIEDVSATLQTVAGEVLGTPAYMSPEQVLGKSVDGRSDLFSLGIILYELATGERPFGRGSKNIATLFTEIVNNDPPDPAEINPHIEPALSQVILKCLNKAPDQRFRTGKELAEALRNCLQDRPTLTQERPAAEVSAAPKEEKPRKRGMFVWLSLSLFVVAGIIAVLFYKEEILALLSKAAILQVESNPKGAEILIDGAPKGKTPLQIKLPLGKHTVRASLAGYKDWEDRVQLEQLKEYPLRVELKPVALLASLKVDSAPAGAEVYLDGAPKGRTPMKSDLPLGKHAVRISLPGYGDWDDVVQMEEAKEYPIQVQLQAILDLANVRIASTPPGAGVFVDGTSEGKTPMGIKLPLGKHALHITLPGYETWDDLIQLDEVKEYPFKVELKPVTKQATLNVDTVPSGAEVYADGTAKGKTPAQVALPLGEHPIRLSLQGYQGWEDRVTLAEAREYPLRVELKRAVKMASLKIKSVPSGAEVVVDGASKGETPVELTLPAGEHTIRINLADHQGWEETVQLEESKELKVELKPVVKEFHLELSSKPPGAQVEIDAKSEGETPLTLKMPSGTYMVTLRLPDYQEWKKRVKVDDKDSTLNAELIPLPKEAFLIVESVPKGATVYVDGKSRGKTPLRLPLSPGPHGVGLRLKGYNNSDDKLDLKDSEERTWSVTLTKVPSKPVITTTQPQPRDEGWIIKPPVDR